MTSFLTSTQPTPAHATFGAYWDAESAEYVIGLTADSQLHLSTADARTLYMSIGASLAERGAADAPTDLAARVEHLARNLHWEGHHKVAEQLAAILDPEQHAIDCTPDTCSVAYVREFGEPPRFDHALADCLYPAGCTGCVDDLDPDHECTAECTFATCVVKHADVIEGRETSHGAEAAGR